MFCYTFKHPVHKTLVTVDSGKRTFASAFEDIKQYCQRHGYPAPATKLAIKAV